MKLNKFSRKCRKDKQHKQYFVRVRMGFNVWCYLPIILVLAVKCLEGSSDILSNGRTSSLIFGNLRQPSEIFYALVRNCRRMPKNSLIY